MAEAIEKMTFEKFPRAFGYIGAAVLHGIEKENRVSWGRRVFRAVDFDFAELNDVPIELVARTLILLERENLVELLDDTAGGESYVATDLGLRAAQAGLADQRSVIFRYDQHGNGWLRDALTDMFHGVSSQLSKDWGGFQKFVAANGTVESKPVAVSDEAVSRHVDLNLASTVRTSDHASADIATYVVDDQGNRVVTDAGEEVVLDTEGSNRAKPAMLGDITSTGEANVAPASDRYVSVSDNRSDFEELDGQLETLKNEIQSNHNLLADRFDNLEARLSDIEIFQRQIEDGHVSRTNALNLRETISYIAGIARDITAITTAITAVGGSLYLLFNLPLIG